MGTITIFLQIVQINQSKERLSNITSGGETGFRAMPPGSSDHVTQSLKDFILIRNGLTPILNSVNTNSNVPMERDKEHRPSHIIPLQT
jgi:hypothetical protein